MNGRKRTVNFEDMYGPKDLAIELLKLNNLYLSGVITGEMAQEDLERIIEQGEDRLRKWAGEEYYKHYLYVLATKVLFRFDDSKGQHNG